MNELSATLTRIRHHYSMLSNAEKRIADYIMNNHKILLNLTAQMLAAASRTSPATIVRFCRSIGFKGFIDFKMYVKQEFAAPSSTWMNVDSDDSISRIKLKTFGFNRNSMDETLSLLDDDALEKAVELIDAAPQVAILSEGGSGSAARSAFDAFLQIGIHCTYIEDPFFQVLAVSQMPENSVALGFNHSGQATGKLAQAFGMKILAHDTYQNPELENEQCRYADLDELFRESDVISLHAPLLPDTEGIISKDSIANMKDGVIILNNSRGPLIVEEDLREALDSGKVYAAGLDVVSAEPIKADNPLLGAKNCIITPHISWAPRESRQRLMDIAVNNLKSFLDGNPVNVVNS